MSAQIYYRQCSLVKGNSTTVSWIPEKYAILDKHLQIKGDDGMWVEGWYVKSIGSERREEATVIAHRDEHRNWRKVTDI